MFFQAYKDLADITNDAQNYLESYQQSQEVNSNPMANAQYYNEKVNVAKEQLRNKQREILDLKQSKKLQIMKIMNQLKEIRIENKNCIDQIDIERDQIVATKQKLEEVQNDIEDHRLEKALIQRKNNKEVQE